jgi:hypothetical protein
MHRDPVQYTERRRSNEKPAEPADDDADTSDRTKEEEQRKAEYERVSESHDQCRSRQSEHLGNNYDVPRFFDLRQSWNDEHE